MESYEIVIKHLSAELYDNFILVWTWGRSTGQQLNIIGIYPAWFVQIFQAHGIKL